MLPLAEASPTVTKPPTYIRGSTLEGDIVVVEAVLVVVAVVGEVDVVGEFVRAVVGVEVGVVYGGVAEVVLEVAFLPSDALVVRAVGVAVVVVLIVLVVRVVPGDLLVDRQLTGGGVRGRSGLVPVLEEVFVVVLVVFVVEPPVGVGRAALGALGVAGAVVAVGRDVEVPALGALPRVLGRVDVH